MKILTIISVAAAIIGLGACAHKDKDMGGSSSMSSTHHHATYSK